MKPQSLLLKFYKNNLVRFDHLRILPSSFDKDIEEKLQSSNAAWPALKKLCGGNEELMFGILQSFLLLPLSFEVHQIETNLQRKKTKEIDRKKRKLEKEIENITKKHVSSVLTFLPDTNEKALIDGARNRLRMDKEFKAGLEDLNDTIKEHEKEKKDWHGKTILDFKNIIYETFLMSKEKTDLSDSAVYNYIAKFLDSLKIRNTQGKPYTPDSIKHHCKTPSR